VELFVQHASARAGEFLLSDVEAPIVAEICRRLDGNPLAIELAASSAALFGVRELAARLDARLALSMKGRRTAPSRQRTLHATWIGATTRYRIGTRRAASTFGVQRPIFPRIGSGRRPDASLGPSHALNALSELSAKSLLVTAASGDSVRYRLLETTRAYAAEKLADAGEEQALGSATRASWRTVRTGGARPGRSVRPNQECSLKHLTRSWPISFASTKDAMACPVGSVTNDVLAIIR